MIFIGDGNITTGPPPKINPMLSIHGTIGYSTPIVELHKELQPGKIYGISGNNGVGKTTLLRTLAGEIFPLSGTFTSITCR